MWKVLFGVVAVASSFSAAVVRSHREPQSGSGIGVEHQVIATTKTSTMEKELNQAAENGFRFEAVMGGDTAFGGNEVVAVVSKPAGTRAGRFGYRLLATNKTSTMQKELQEASSDPRLVATRSSAFSSATATLRSNASTIGW